MAKYVFEGSAVGTYVERCVFVVEASSEEEARQAVSVSNIEDVYETEHLETDKTTIELDELIEVEE